MVTDRFDWCVRSRQWACLLAAVCLLVGSSFGCGRKEGATIDVAKASVSSSGVINLEIQIEQNGGPLRVSDSLKAGTTETVLNDLMQGGRSPTMFTNEFETAEPSSVQFLVKQGESVFIPAGAEEDLLRFTPRGEPKGMAALYTIRIRKPPR